MRKIWIPALLTLALCVSGATPALAQEDAAAEAVIILEEPEESADCMVETSEPETEPTETDANTQAVETSEPETGKQAAEPIETDADAQAAEPSEPETDASVSGEFAADTSLPEATETAENEWTVDLSDTPDVSAIGLTEDAADQWSAATIADAEQVEVALDAANFPDEAFRSYLSEKFDKDGSGGLSAEEIAAVTEIDVIGKEISDLSGIAYFTGLTGLYCDNNQLTALDVGKNTKLKTLTCTGNLLGSLDVKQNTLLISLVCSNNQIVSLDLSQNSKLQDLRCAGNQIGALDISGNAQLVWLDCSRNSLTALDASDHQSLQYLFCSANQLSSLNVSESPKLQWLECQQNQLTELNVTGVLNVNASNDSAVNILNCADNKLTSLKISNKSYFKGLICSNNALTELDLSTNPDLRQLECANNALTSLDVTSNKKLQTLDCSGNQITGLDLSNLSITTTTVLPNCSGQTLPMNFERTDSGLQINLKKALANENINVIRMTKEEFSEDAGTEKSVYDNVILLSQDDKSLNGNLQDGVLTFTSGMVPEKIDLFCATGYKKKTGEKDVLLEISLLHTHTSELLEKDEPTCTETGRERKKCAECDAEIITILPALGHNYQFLESKEATCAEGGYSKEQCTICHDEITTLLPATKQHQYNLIKYMPTCTEDGLMYQQCSVCGDKGPETVLPAIGHDYQLVSETLPTCTTEGVTLKKCSRCGHEISSAIPATGHQYGAYTVVREATIFADGLKVRTCSLCKTVQEQTIPKLNGTVSITVGSLPLQIEEKVSVQSLVTGLQEDDCVVSWVSGNPEIAVISGDGTITAKQTGYVDITVTTKSGATAVMTVKVQTDEVATEGIAGLAKHISLTAGEKLRLTPVLTPISSQQEITYKSSDKKVARVSAKGVVKGIRKGTAKITVKSGSQKFVVNVKVKASEVQKIKHVPAKKTLREGTSFRLKPRLAPTGCKRKVTYKSSNKKVASVTAKGKIKAKKKGTAKITVIAGSIKAVCKITVIK